MDALKDAETRRTLLQDELDARKTQGERNRLGQFATPRELAFDVLAHAHTIFPENVPIRFLDPAVGTGAFYSALLGNFPAHRIKLAMGIEVDPHYGEPARKLWSNHPVKIVLDDFTTIKPPEESGRFNLIICNPPYVRHHHLKPTEKGRLQFATKSACGIRMAGLSGLYCYFIGLAHAWLAEDGIAAWLIPSEFMDVNYGAPIKRYLLNEVELLRIHRFDPNARQFEDALVSSAVACFRKRRPEKAHQIEFSYGGTLTHPAHLRVLSSRELQNVRKWSGLAADGVKVEALGFRLSDFFVVKRGLATGNNKFFILSRAEIEARGLPLGCFTPILPGPRHLKTDVVYAFENGAPRIERQQYILDCRWSEKEVKARYPSLWDYLQTGKPKVSKTYLCSRRRPWYAQENRPAAPFICTYMARGSANRLKPFRFILNHSIATAANVYLMLYPRTVLAEILEHDPDLSHRIWEFLNSIPAETLLGEGRVYGGGLYKMEPKELANVPADAIASLLPTALLARGRQRQMFEEQISSETSL
ncbi:MAG: Eco57I restriction-modification methylase domain-containing protein [Candidatus Binataceae bacterium]|nr:Eco57I restriction-modification methylase domain-containing protein [Candidatus Binataceae bacterium]